MLNAAFSIIQTVLIGSTVFAGIIVFYLPVMPPKHSVLWFHEYLSMILYAVSLVTGSVLLLVKLADMDSGHFQLTERQGCLALCTLWIAGTVLWSFWLQWVHRAGSRTDLHSPKPSAVSRLLLFLSPHIYCRREKSKKQFYFAGIFCTLLFMLGLLLIAVTSYIRLHFPDMDWGTVWFTIRFANAAKDTVVLKEFFRKGSLMLLVSVLIGIFYYLRRNERGKTQTLSSPDGSAELNITVTKIQMFSGIWLPSLLLLIGAALFACFSLKVWDYLYRQTHKTQLYEMYFADPNTVGITFPEEKRNLVYIYLESYENTFSSQENGGDQSEDYMPELAALASENINFSNTEKLGGASVFFSDISFTMGSTIAQTSGIALNSTIITANEAMSSSVLPKSTTLEDLLHEQGYRQVFMQGSDAEFASYNTYVGRYDNSQICDYNYAVSHGMIPDGYKEMWGFEDSKLFSFAKDKLTELAAGDEPFCLTMYTMDTHSREYGYRCELCDPAISDDYMAAVRCSSKQVSAFVEWIEAQPFYENTVIILVGDHLVSAEIPGYIGGNANDGYTRTTYNCIIHAAKEPEQEKNRAFSSLDMFPTTLSALGADIEGGRLGLGTDLFSGQPTLCEELGTQYFLSQIQLRSDYYFVMF